MIAKPFFVAACLVMTILPVNTQPHQTAIGEWWPHEIQGLENYYSSHAVCGFPLTDRDRALIVEAYAKINEFLLLGAAERELRDTQSEPRLLPED